MANLFNEIGSKIEHFLKKNGMSQVEMADRIGVSKQVMGKIIHGKKAVNLVEIGKIAELMNVSIDSLICQEKTGELGEPIFLMMGSVKKANSEDDLRFLNHVMDEMIALEELS